jgi:hypothetical protein
MSSHSRNPYQASALPADHFDPRKQVKTPAIGLIAVSAFALIVGVLGLLGDAFLLLTGLAERLDAAEGGTGSAYETIVHRSIWGIALLIAAAFVLYGSIRMLSLKSYGVAKAAAIVAMIPLLGPCCLLGIPFGIWAFVVLRRPEVQSAFARIKVEHAN